MELGIWLNGRAPAWPVQVLTLPPRPSTTGIMFLHVSLYFDSSFLFLTEHITAACLYHRLFIYLFILFGQWTSLLITSLGSYE